MSASLVINILTGIIFSFTQMPNWSLLLISISLFFVGTIQTFVNWHNRQRSYRTLGLRNAIERLVVLVLSIALGFLGLKQSGLATAQTLGLFCSLAYLFYLSGEHLPRFSQKLWRETF